MQTTDPLTASPQEDTSQHKSVELESLSEELAVSTANTSAIQQEDEEQQPMNISQDRQAAIISKFASYFSSYQYKPPRRIGNLFFFCYTKQKVKFSPQQTVLTLGENQRDGEEIMVPFICLPYIWMALTSIPVCIITCMMASMEITGMMQMQYVSFWKAKFLLFLFIFYAVYCVLRILTTNPGVSELVFYEREKAERRKYALNKLREDIMSDQSDDAIECIIRGQQGSLNQSQEQYRMCSHCLIKKSSAEADITHCSICGICVEDLDHHCVFFGKCIARDNIQFFNCSICLFVVTVAYFVVLMLFDGMQQSSHNVHRYRSHKTGGNAVAGLPPHDNHLQEQVMTQDDTTKISNSNYQNAQFGGSADGALMIQDDTLWTKQAEPENNLVYQQDSTTQEQQQNSNSKQETSQINSPNSTPSTSSQSSNQGQEIDIQQITSEGNP